MANAPLPSIERLRNLFRYEPETGKLYHNPRELSDFTSDGMKSAEWLCRIWNANWAGREAGYNSYGYCVICTDRKKIPAHRLVWALVKGEWPEGQIDHINGIRSDNRIENLRDIPSAENQRNMRRSKANTSGVTGVSWFKPTGQWAARIESRGVRYQIGYFNDIESARVAVEAKRRELGFPEGHGSDRPGYRYHKPIRRQAS